MNTNMSGTIIQTFCHNANLVEAITALHGKARVPMHQQGSMAINGIFLSPLLIDTAQGGFLSLGSNNCNHLDLLVHIFVFNSHTQIS